MTTPDPDAIGPQLPQPDPRGILVFQWLPDDLQRAEDETQAADFHRMQTVARKFPALPKTIFPRPATRAERELLNHLKPVEHLGIELPERLVTWVYFVTAGVRRRVWPQLQYLPQDEWVVKFAREMPPEGHPFWTTWWPEAWQIREEQA